MEEIRGSLQFEYSWTMRKATYERTRELEGINNEDPIINLIPIGKRPPMGVGIYEGTADIPVEGGSDRINVRVAIKLYNAFLPRLGIGPGYMSGSNERGMWYLALEEEQKIKDKKVTLNGKEKNYPSVIQFGQFGEDWHLFNIYTNQEL